MATATELQQLEKELAAAKEPEPIRMKLATGEEVVGKDWEEIAKNLQKMKEDTTLAYRNERSAREMLEQQVETLKTPARPEPSNGDGFSSEQYWKLLNDGKIIEAQNYVDGFRFGMKPEEVVPTFTGTVKRVDGMYDEIEIAKFKNNHPDFAPTAENSKLVFERVATYGQEWDANTLHRAYKDLVEEGRIKPLEVKTEERPAEEVRFIPSLTGGGGGDATVEANIEKLAASMTDAELQAYMAKKGMFRS